MAIIKTANSHQTSLLVSEHIPDFVRSDHPKFVTFIEKYYEFLANNSLMQTSDGTNYYGADYASKAISDIHDIDTTDIDLFIESFQKQYAVNFPISVYNNEDTRILYKNILDFYRALGTEDSFKMLFRLIYNEDIEIYYPKQDMLIASGGDFTRQVRVRVGYVANLNIIESGKIVGANSGAYGTVDSVSVLPPKSLSYIPGRIANTSKTYTYGKANSDIYDPQLYVEKTQRDAFINLTDQHGNFHLFEDIYYVQNNVTNFSVSNTKILPLTTNELLFDNFSSVYPNSVVSFTDGLHYKSSNSQYRPWGSSNIAYSNTGYWYTHGSGQGEIKIIANTSGGFTTIKSRLQIGNNSVKDVSGDLRHFVSSKNIPFYYDKLYKLTVRARDLGGNSAVFFAEGNKFSAGISCIRHDFYKISSDYTDTYDNPLWLACHQQAIDDEFFVYTAYFKGIQNEYDTTTLYPSKNYGSGGRIDLTSGTRSYNSIHKAINGETILPYNTVWIKPTIKVNEPSSDVTFSQGITEIDYIKLEEIGTMQSDFDAGVGSYKSESSLLSTSGAHLQDGYYRQTYAYDLRTHQQMQDYNTVVRKTTHPASLKMFGTKITESRANNISISSAFSQSHDPFTPYTINSLAGWWKADSIGPQNIEWKKLGQEISSNGIFGTNRNRMPVGSATFEDSSTQINSYIWGGVGPALMDTVHVGYTNIESPPIGGSKSLKITDHHTSSVPNLTFGPTTNPYTANTTASDYTYPLVLEPNKKWLFSCYATTSNLISDVADRNSFKFRFFLANTSGADSQIGPTLDSGWNENFSAVNTWERKANTIDLTSYSTTRVAPSILLPDRNSFTAATGNTYYLIDGIMVEEYIPEIHGTEAPYTPSLFVMPGMNGANVVSWHDQSLNDHHVYANTHGGMFYSPQFIANAINGMPAVRFSSNTVNAFSIAKGFASGNVYPYSSIGGTVQNVSGTKPPTIALQARTMLASNSLSRPVSNAWTVMAVAKTNLMTNQLEYGRGTNIGGSSYIAKQTILNSGYQGTPTHEQNSSPMEFARTSGALDLSITPASATQTYNGKFFDQWSNGSVVNIVESPRVGTNTNSFSIFGVSEYAANTLQDGLNFHFNGRRYANNELTHSGGGGVLGPIKYDNDGIVWDHQTSYVTSIGGWAPSNNQIWDSSKKGVNQYNRYGKDAWDGDIAEILVFNEKLSNTNISLIEGYLALKYGLQTSLVHKDGTSAANTFAKNWTFLNSANGWATGSGTITKHAANLQFTGSESTPHSIYNNFRENPINGSGYQSIKIRFYRNAYTAGQTWVGRFSWNHTLQHDDPWAAGGPARRVVFKGSAPATDAFYDYYITPSDLAGKQWDGYQITGLRVEFTTATDAASDYYIDDISVYDATRTHHPFRYDAPTSISEFANTWYKDY